MPSLHQWTYLSRSLIAADSQQLELTDIVERSRPKNAGLLVTGALAFSGMHFAQVIEGPPEAIEALRGTIQRDARHTDVTTLSYGRASQRAFQSWSLAYSGPSLLVTRTLSNCFRQAQQGMGLANDEIRHLLATLVANVAGDDS